MKTCVPRVHLLTAACSLMLLLLTPLMQEHSESQSSLTFYHFKLLFQFIDMASNNKVSESETRNADGSAMEKRVETVGYQSTPAGPGQTERRDVEVVHQYTPSEADSGSGAGGMVADAAASMASSIRSAKDAISGKANESSK
ncbi:hypothetical protein CKAN_00609400 [Cinnamomum micranthum f. kanehirae]|uniref:Uncharacterized protein n=1 Tax=Cinnamomum micranthum f. kanehirae TaxID=337451 RepID=A0A443NGJ8_9MAGN|nr:hypothetical protein CKAN_00609400 [Cinnamomum micranthum f. kanehirae]